MYTFSPITPRVARIRERYRTTQPAMDLARYRLVTDFYQEHGEINGILRRTKKFRKPLREHTGARF